MKVLGTKVEDKVYETFKEKAKESGFWSISEALKILVYDFLMDEGYAPYIKKEVQKIKNEYLKREKECQRLHAELGKVGNNINQIARQLNKKRLPAKERKLLIDLVIETIDLVQNVKTKLAEEKFGNPEKD